MPVSATFYASFIASTDADLANGDLSSTLTNSPTISSSYLDLTGDAVKYLSFPASNNVNVFTNQATFVFKFKTSYSGGPPTTDACFFEICKTTSDASNQVQFVHALSSKSIYMTVTDGGNSNVISSAFGAFTAVSGVEYQAFLKIDLTNGSNKVFIYPVGSTVTQIGSTSTNTGTRSNTIGMFRIGTNRLATNRGTFWISDFYVYNGAYDPSSILPAQRCTVWIRYLDASNQPVSGATFTAQALNATTVSGTSFYANNSALTTTTDADGFAKLALIPSTKLTNASKYSFQLSEGETIIFNKTLTVPNQNQAEFNDLS